MKRSLEQKQYILVAFKNVNVGNATFANVLERMGVSAPIIM